MKTFIESSEAMEELLREETLGFLGVSVGETPYVVPLTYCYVEGKIFFHGSLTGKRLDHIRKNQRVCFTVARRSGPPVRHPYGGLCQCENDSVICYGVARVLDDPEERRDALNVFNRRLGPDAKEITVEEASHCIAVEIAIREMTGRRQRGLEYTYWRHRFGD
jgi:nitroimidazol reductase NimA-like FMN-containing flavoprotein (pyridoxamine 5'-phosphate oxidase superfamily)